MICSASARPCSRRTPTPTVAIKRALGLAGKSLEIDEPLDASADITYVDAVSGALMLLPHRVREIHEAHVRAALRHAREGRSRVGRAARGRESSEGDRGRLDRGRARGTRNGSRGRQIEDELFEDVATFRVGGRTLRRLGDTMSLLHACVHASLGARPPLLVPTLGGSGPSYLFTKVLGVPVVTLPIANADNNQHAANENLRLQNLWDGIELYAGLLAALGTVWARPVP